MTTQWHTVLQAAHLLTLPEVYLRLKALLDDPDYTLAEVAVLISTDPAMTARLLRVINSSLYAFVRKIDTVSRAIVLLGPQQVHDLVLATSVASLFKGIPPQLMDVRRFWQSSIYCATAARRLAELHGGCDLERLFVAGLLHGIGHPLIYQALPEQAHEVLVRAGETDKPVHLLQRERLGFDYAEAGAALLEKWALPESLVTITRNHVAPDQTKRFGVETALVHFGCLLAQAMDGAGRFNEGPLTVNPAAWEMTGLTSRDCEGLVDQIKTDTAEITTLFFEAA